MGNIIRAMAGPLMVSTASIFTPFVTEKIIVPFLFEPGRLGSIPWTDPSAFYLGSVGFLVKVAILVFFGVISNTMGSLRQCKKWRFAASLKRSLWILVGWLGGTTLLTILPFIKMPLLAVFFWLPYADWFVHGFVVSIFVFISAIIGRGMTIRDVC
jgi:hypothetical protein